MNLREKAKKTTESNGNNSAVCNDREKIKLEELVAACGNKLHIKAVDVLQVNDQDTKGKREAAAMVVVENDKVWTFGGATLLNIIKEWLTPENPDEPAYTIDQVNEELGKEPLYVKVTKENQKNDPRKTFWRYEILE